MNICPELFGNRVIFTLLFEDLIFQRVNKPRGLTLNLKGPRKPIFSISILLKVMGSCINTFFFFAELGQFWE